MHREQDPGPGAPTELPRRGQKMQENSGNVLTHKTCSSDLRINPSQPGAHVPFLLSALHHAPLYEDGDPQGGLTKGQV